MASSSRQAYDDTGKVVFDDIYVQPDPRAYFGPALRDLGYRIPGEAKPVFRDAIGAWRQHHGRRALHVLDIGCSYGINAALLATDLGMDDLFAHYGDATVRDLSRDELLAHDRRFYSAHRTDPDLTFTGIDAAVPAVRYAEAAGLLDTGIGANLEEETLDAAGREAVGRADMVISTGAVGYVTERTIGQLLDAFGGRRPWMVHGVLRMFPFEPFARLLRAHGYAVDRLEGTLKQRRFASEAEQAHVLDNLREVGVDPAGKEAEGWYHADVYVAQPT